MVTSHNLKRLIFCRVCPLLLIVWALAACQQSGSSLRTSAPTTGRAEAQPAQARQVHDYDVQMLNASDRQLSPTKLSQLVKGKVVVIDFWATWCGPCKQEIPNLVALQQTYRDKGVEVIGLSIEDPNRDKDLVADMANSLRINYRVGFASDEMFGAFTESRVIPQTFIFGKDGTLVKHIRGSGPSVSAILKESVEKALNGAAAQS
jgi:thiol-disulfide isomerase/thioredoxin